MVSIIQFILSIVIFAVLGFGIGFIINMVLRTTWLPTLIAFAFVFGVLLFKGIVPKAADIIILSFGLIGTITSGWTIQTLRKKGYRMF
jgi:hypothetical protein